MGSDSESEEMSSSPPPENQLAVIATENLLPAISRERYEVAYKSFMEWKEKNNANSFSESVLLSYFGEISQRYKSSTLWSLYSMLKASIIVKHNINISTYTKLKAVLKRHSDGYVAKKSNTLTPEEIKQFIETAPDVVYLLTKVALVFGISGALRSRELCNMKLHDLRDFNSALLVMIPVSKNKTLRSFTITGKFYEIYKKYASLRPNNLSDQNQRFFVNYQKGKCTSQFVGINKFGNMVKEIAKFLNLPNAETYTGHSFRRSAATIVVDSGGELLRLKRPRSNFISEGYINDAFNKRTDISNGILQSAEVATINRQAEYEMHNMPHLQRFDSPNHEEEIYDETKLSISEPVLDPFLVLKEEQLDGYVDTTPEELTRTTEKHKKKKRDECEIYGELIAEKLRKMEEKTRQFVMHKIDNLIFEMTFCQPQMSPEHLQPTSSFMCTAESSSDI